ncbi:hypothetical protein, partial [uncultured Phocaeicola sp.]|uniref:hypothetical protein n=1 Tax=uncultured Phocaeicola sp. TaxID=990718 RepID=UPI0025A9DACD
MAEGIQKDEEQKKKIISHLYCFINEIFDILYFPFNIRFMDMINVYITAISAFLKPITLSVSKQKPFSIKLA